MYLGSWKINDYLTIPCNTHTPSTGAATDADAVPTYRIYEDDTGTAIDNGNTAKLDDANTTGFYAIRLQLLSATGYEKGKTYTIYISATVGGIIGTMSHSFQIEAEVDANIVSDKTGFSMAADQSAVTVGTVSTLTGHTVQTGDSYPIVSHTDYGNAKLVRSTTPANALDISATGEAGLDFDNIKDATGAHTLTNITIPVTTTITNEVTADAVKISGDSTAADNLELDYDGTGFAKSNSTIGTCTSNTDMRGTDSANTVVPDVAGTAATLHGVTDGKIDTVDTNVASILVDTGTTLPATLTTVEGKIDTVDTNVDAILVDTGTTIPGTISTLQTDSTAIKAKTDNLPSGIAKNIALTDFNVFMVLSSDHVTAATSKTITCTISKDGGAFASATNPVTELASGLYKIDLTQPEMNAGVIILRFTNVDCDDRVITVYTS